MHTNMYRRSGHQQTWSRVSLEPYVPYLGEGESRSYCHPDIVIWDVNSEGQDPPSGQLWPILWACELKYGSMDDGAYDVKKLGILIEEGRIRFGCSVRVNYIQSEHEIAVRWSYDPEHKRHLTVCDVSMPRPGDGA